MATSRFVNNVLSLIFRRKMILMALSQDLLDALNKADASKEVAATADANHQMTVDELNKALQDEDGAKHVSLDAHKTALDDATAALDKVKVEFGIV